MSDHIAVTEDTLITRATQGDRRAFEQLYRRHVGPVYTYLLYSLPSREDAEETTQEVFVRAWSKLHQFRGEAALATWLVAIAVSSCRMWHRRRRSRVREIALVDQHDAESDRRCPNAVGRAASDADAMIDLRRAIHALPPRARNVLVLHELSGYRHSEIAELLGIAVGTSKAQLSRARRLLAEALTDG